MKLKSIMDTRSKLFIWRQRIGYGSADFACNLIWQMISLYLLYYYISVAKLDGMKIASMFVICRLIDAITDLFFGYLIDKTSTRWGKSRPYFLWGSVPFAVFAFLTFSVPTTLSEGATLIYCYLTYTGLSIMYTIVNIPMASILPALTDDPQERTNLATTRQFFAFLGSTLISLLGLKMVSFFGHGNDAVGFKYTMLIFGIVGAGIFIFTFFNVREIPNRGKVDHKINLRSALVSLKDNGPWKIFAVNILFMWVGYFLQAGALIFYYTAVVGSRNLSVVVATIMSLVPVVSNLTVPFLARLYTKKNLFITASMIQILGCIVIGLAHANYIMIIIGAIVSALGYGVKTSIYFSMQADPVDYGIWKTGVDTAGIQSAINGFLGKISQAVAGGISGVLIAWGGYKGEGVQSDKALNSITLMYLLLPIMLNLISVVIMLFYKLDKIYPQIQKDLNERKHIIK
ncbi:sugar (Glycoside-Pentoside-Hexuronide) transporter [Lactococcus piscium]|uniref:Sugar (Glycoside-Pentoside-Hexuronide) transporter n=1 Tax=Pseudolactococcus piscium TaxID=1364 RepID=A0A2A5S2Y7_9LACT|nr:MFS transporter [Lactococcus piscium]PCS07808.1 sugar (Glycoside-Pentoside-Hexuronide) transporter [Lactococcus piscium]